MLTSPQGGHAGRSRSANVVLAALSGRLALVASEVEELILQDRAADLAAIAVEVVARIGNLAALNGVLGVQISVLEVFVGGTMNLVGAADNDGIELTADRVAELGGKLVGNDGELANGSSRNIDERAGDRLVVVVDTFNGEVVGARTHAANRGAGSVSECAAGGNAGNQKGEVQNTKAHGRGRHILQFFGFKGSLQLGGRRVEHRGRFRRYLNIDRCGGDRKNQLRCARVVQLNQEIFQREGRKAIGATGDVVISGK